MIAVAWADAGMATAALLAGVGAMLGVDWYGRYRQQQKRWRAWQKNYESRRAGLLAQEMTKTTERR